ncbi:hypothetical protein FOVG_18923 [Fusarium oxysporum f. sp. pisi HDV247]|uniref:Uncharacterized protein n=1 Tax=Fusarium oxysporum f. sp. pisi HDV247 TaxID=1080344 RepID=W9NHW5_FUSOX|nr:hypothetical protein FOVG_18923 [Fusarium oxysporum f. sp. pisi HDV247]
MSLVLMFASTLFKGPPLDDNLTSVPDTFKTGDSDDSGFGEEDIDTVDLTQHNDEDYKLPLLPPL